MPASYIKFAEERLELGHDYGVVGSRSFKTEIINNGALDEQRNGTTWRALGRWQLGERMLLDDDEKNIKEVEYLLSFHEARKGSKQGFRFKDWSDYQVKNQLLGTSEGVTTTFQLKKSYQVGSVSYIRPILKPVENTVKVYLDDLETIAFSVNYSNGLLTLDTIPTVGTKITCDFEFDVPVTFDRDKIDWTLEAARTETGDTLHKLGTVFVVEMRINLDLEWYHFDPIPQTISDPLDLGWILEASEEKQFSTRSASLENGYQATAANRQTSKTLVRLPARNFNREELQHILNYFYVARGRLCNLTVLLNGKTYPCRFNADGLSITYEHHEGLYQIAGLDFLSTQTANYQILFGSLPSSYVANSFILINGQVQTEDGEPVGNISYEVDFPFAVTPTIEFTTNENGYFSIQFQTRSDLAFPETGTLTFTNQQTNLVDAAIDVEVQEPDQDSFTLSVPAEYFWKDSNNTINISGNASPGNAVNLSVPELSLNSSVTADIANSYSYQLTIPDNFAGNQLTVTASTSGFGNQTEIVTVIRNAHNPQNNFQNFRYN